MDYSSYATLSSFALFPSVARGSVRVPKSFCATDWGTESDEVAESDYNEEIMTDGELLMTTDGLAVSSWCQRKLRTKNSTEPDFSIRQPI